MISAALLAGCSTTPAAGDDIPVRGESPGYACRSEGLSRFFGQIASAAAGAAMMRESGARSLRWTAPDIAVTMDLRSDRLNVELDAAHQRIVGASCG
jgi:hypothetical protein